MPRIHEIGILMRLQNETMGRKTKKINTRGLRFIAFWRVDKWSWKHVPCDEIISKEAWVFGGWKVLDSVQFKSYPMLAAILCLNMFPSFCWFKLFYNFVESESELFSLYCFGQPFRNITNSSQVIWNTNRQILSKSLESVGGICWELSSKNRADSSTITRASFGGQSNQASEVGDFLVPWKYHGAWMAHDLLAWGEMVLIRYWKK